jgi:hypothetical protein
MVIELGMGLSLFMAVIWAMVLAVAAFLVMVVGPIDALLNTSRLAVSAVQAAVAVASVVALAFGLSRLKNAYLRRKLGESAP